VQRQRQCIRDQYKEPENAGVEFERRKEEVPGGRKWRLSKMLGGEKLE